MLTLIRLIPAAIVATGLLQAQESILLVNTANFVYYSEDNPDSKIWSTKPGPGTASSLGNFSRHIFVSDIVSVNGTPAKGTVVGRVQSTRFRPVALAGTGIADISRNNISEMQFEFLKDDGTQVGSLILSGFGGVTTGPGSPTNGRVGVFAILGGTGAFMGARGQGSVVEYAPRNTSITEDTSERRLHPGAGAWSMVIRITPTAHPQVLAQSGISPSIFHADFSPVTAQNPAHGGELLIAACTGLGPVSPNLDPGQPFPDAESGKLYIVTSPVSVTVNGQPARVVNQIGWPTMTDVYRVDFEVPSGTPTGEATLDLSVAWMKGPAVTIHVR